MISNVDTKERMPATAKPIAVFPFPIRVEPQPSGKSAAQSYSSLDAELPMDPSASDFDWLTIAAVSSIVLFKAVLLGLLIYAL